MQKCINQARLADALEEVNIQVVNDIGVDINLVCEHEHMSAMLQFVSGFGPRKSKKLISNISKIGKKLTHRNDLVRQKLMGQEVFFVSHPFIQVRVPDEDLSKLSSDCRNFYILDQTRIHLERRNLAFKIASDAAKISGREVDMNDKNAQLDLLREVMASPSQLD